METRKETEIPYLGEQPLEQILGARCPTKSDVFRHFFYLRYTMNLSVSDAQQSAVDAARKFWSQAGIVTKLNQYAKDDLAKIFEKYKVSYNLELHYIHHDRAIDVAMIKLKCKCSCKDLKKSAKASSFPRLLATFKDELKEVFDLGGKNVLDKKENKSAEEFIADQVAGTAKNYTTLHCITIWIQF